MNSGTTATPSSATRLDVGETVPRSGAPPAPQSVQETGLSSEAIADLLVKTLYVRGARTGKQLVDGVGLPFSIVDDQLLDLQQRRCIAVRGTAGHGRGGYTFELTSAGTGRAREALSASEYVGPAPVPLEQYRAQVEAQSVRDVVVTRSRIREGFEALVLGDELLEVLGPAINSAKSVFLYGEPGNGKTVIAETIARLLGQGGVYIPHAVDVDGEIVLLYDAVFHRTLEPATQQPGAPDAADDVDALLFPRAGGADRRYAYVARPVVVTGGELTLDQLDLQYDPQARIYQAPFQMKANGGVLIIDDFGRQRVPPRQLLNRWIVPLEKRRDYLALHGGVKFPVPFDCLLLLATNLEPKELVEEAFLRRIHYKVQVPSPSRQQYEEIFRRACRERGIEYDQRAVEFVYRRYYEGLGITPRGCHPRDVTDHVCDFARYLEREPGLTPDLLERACDSYFVVTAPEAMRGSEPAVPENLESNGKARRI